MPTATIGVDESGKGDFFGPLVIAAVVATEKDSATLTNLGVRDGKTLTETRIDELDSQIRELLPTFCQTLMPESYNPTYQKTRNLNKLLAWGHAAVIEEAVRATGAGAAISDKFGKPELIENELARKGVDLHLTQVVRAEKFPVVAAASIVARAQFIRSMHSLSETFAVDLPRGAAAQVDNAGRKFAQIHGVDKLRLVAKLHFKNYDRVVTHRR